jgi:signal transduction histidine kinase
MNLGQDRMSQMAADLEKIISRIKDKRQSFQEYRFDPLENDALKTFFDLAQEYETLDNFYRLSVGVVKEFFGLDCALYLVSREGSLRLVCDSLQGVYPDQPPASERIRLVNQAYFQAGSWIGPIKGNMILVDRLPFYAKEQPIGMLEVFPEERLTERRRFFLEKYTNRLGYNLHNKIIAWQNIQHIRFINSLVGDIEHNIILPNISLSLYLRKLKSKIKSLRDLECNCFQKDSPEAAKLQDLVEEMEQDYQTLERQYRGVSLFIESLFRPSHFQKGHLVLRRRTTRVLSDIISPQLQLFLPKLKERNIDIDVGLGGVPDVDFPLSVDKGLISQVYANLFSNAVKYARTNHEGRRYMSFGREELKDFFGPGKDGIKFNVFTTGPHIPPEDVPRIFDEGYRGSNTEAEVGTGRGLYFMRNVIETHGGVVGYEPTYEGNNFYFVLPLVTGPEPPLSVEIAGSSNS